MVVKGRMLVRRMDIFSLKDWKKERSQKVAVTFHIGFRISWENRIWYRIFTVKESGCI